MTRPLAAAFLAGVLFACAPAPAPPGPATTPKAPASTLAQPASVPAAPLGKPAAPVEVEAALQPGAARIAVTFGADAADVSVRLSGADGLRVTSAAAPLEHGSYRRGERAAVEAAFVPGEGESYLVVAVEGTFAGARRGAVRSFAVGKRTPAQEEKARAGVVADPQGGRVHVLPAERR